MAHYPLGFVPGGSSLSAQLPPNVNYTYITDEFDLLVLAKILNKPSIYTNEPFMIFADIETDGLYINQRLLQLYIPEYNKTTQYLIDYDYLDDFFKGLLKDIIANNHTVWQGGNYDLGTMNLLKVPFKLDDTLAMSRIAYPLWDGYGLDQICSRLGITIYDDLGLDKKALQKAKFKLGVPLTPDQLNYAAADVLVLAHIYYRPEMAVARKNKTYKLDMLNLGYCAIYQQNAIQVDANLIQNRIAEAQTTADVNTSILVNKYNSLNVNSPKQCREALGTENSNKLTLITAIGEGNELAQIIYDQRRLLKAITMMKSYLVEGGVVTRYNPMGAVTGRFSATGGDMSNGVNLQQIPRALKDCFVARPGNMIVGADYPTIELRCIASIYPNVPNILKRVNPALMASRRCNNIERRDVSDQMYDTLIKGIDLHKQTACALTGLTPEEIDPETRFKAKAVNFGYAFAMGPAAFQDYAYTSYGLVYTFKEASNVHKIYHQTYPEVSKAIKYISTAMYSNRSSFVVSTALGRKIKPQRLTDAINAMIQGTAAEVMKLALHYMYTQEPNILNYIVWVIHDAVYLDVPEDQAEYYRDIIKVNMENAWFEVSKQPHFKYKDVPMDVEVSIANNTKAI
jgi:DNA polymerase-1